jgi:hypothetical protein
MAGLIHCFDLAAKTVGYLEILPTGQGVAQSKAIACSLDHLLGDVASEPLRGEKFAKRLVGQHATGVVVATALSGYAGFSKSQSPGWKHGEGN